MLLTLKKLKHFKIQRRESQFHFLLNRLIRSKKNEQIACQKAIELMHVYE